MRRCTYIDPRNQERCTECGVTIALCMCSEPDDIAYERHHSPDGNIYNAIKVELAASRLKFPGRDFMVEALIEEVGELAKALMEHTRGEGETDMGIFRKAVQVAAMAIRIGTEGDSTHEYDPSLIWRE